MAFSTDRHGNLVGFKKTALDKISKERHDYKNRATKAEKQVKQAEALLADKDEEIETLKLEVDEVTKENQGLTKENEKLKEKLEEALKALKDGGKFSKKEQNKSIKEKIDLWVRDIGFRTVKFAKDDALEKFTKDVFDGIKRDLNLEDPDQDHYCPEKEFVRIYQNVVQATLGNRRQYIQTGIFKAFVSKSNFGRGVSKVRVPHSKFFASFKDWYKDHEALPDYEWFSAPYEVPTEDTPQAKLRREFAVWYHDEFLFACAGKENFKSECRHYRMPVQQMKVAGTAIKGAHVTKESEALGLVIVANCYQKWTYLVPQKAKDDRWTIPAHNKDDEETHKYHTTRWSDGRNGQVKGSGWAPEAYEELNNAILEVKKFRAEDKKENWKQHRAVLALVQEKHGIEKGTKEPTKKRKRKSTAKEPVKYVAVAELSDDDCESDDE